MNRRSSWAASTLRAGIACAAFACVYVQPALAGNARWTSNGPFGGRVDSAVPGTGQPNVFYATAHRSVYRSNDGGNTWVAATAGLATVSAGAGVVVPHPTLPGRLLLAGARGVFATQDSGRSWLRKDVGLPTTTTSFRTVDIAYAPSDPTRVFLATADAGLFRSVDGGSTWSPAGGSTLPNKLDRLAVDPNDPLKILVWVLERDTSSFSASLYKSINGGASFSPITGPWNSGGPTTEPVSLLAYNPNIPGTVFVSNVFGNYRSTDGGASFLQSVSLPVGPTQRMQSLDVHPSATNNIVFGSSNGVLFSPDNGASFAPRNNGLSVTVGDPASIGPIIVDPANPSRWIAFSVSGEVFVTNNAGTNWSVIGAGLRGTRIETVAVHPTRPQRVYAGLRNLRTEATSAALYLSDDFGQNWLRTNANLGLDTVNAIVFDPVTASSPATTRMFALGADFAPLGALPNSFRGGIFRSSDGGVSWAVADNLIPLPETGPAAIGEVNTMLIDPLSAEGGLSQVIYFGANGRVACLGNSPQLEVPRIWRSSNGSISWTPRDTLPLGGCQPRLMYPQPVAMVFQSGSATTLYAGTRLSGYCFSCNDPVPTLANGVFKSTNSGLEWTSASAGLPLMSSTGSVQNINSLIAIPGQPNNLFAALSDPTKPDEPGRVYKTINGGASWVPADNGIANVRVRVLRVEPANPGRVYAGAAGSDTSPGGVYFTDNGGTSWLSISIGLPLDSAQSLAVSVPVSGSPTVHAGTDEGVWSLTRVPDADIDGPSDADENLAPNSGDGNADGTPDRLQTDVATITIADVNPGAAKGGSGSTTISNIDLRKAGSSCQQIFDATSVDPELLPEDPGYLPNAGLIRFEFINCTTAQVLATFHAETFGPDWVFRRFGPATSGNALTLQWLGMGNGAIRNGRSFLLTVTDNGPGDLRQESGRILFVGGPVQEQPLFNNGFE